MKYLRYFESKKKFPNIKTYLVDDNGTFLDKNNTSDVKFTILVGLDAESNDYLTTKMANDDDIWLHTTNKIRGSHVVLKVDKTDYTQESKLPTKHIIEVAAKIAKKHSQAPKDQPCEVRFCQKKFVHKKPGMNVGQVGVDDIIEQDESTKITVY